MSRRPKNWWSIAGIVLMTVVIALSVAAIVVSLAAAWYESEAGSPVNVAVGGRADDVVRIQGHIGDNQIEPGAPVECWFLVQNTGDVPINDLRLRGWSASGFEPVEFEPRVVTSLAPRSAMFFRPRSQLTSSLSPRKFNVTAEFEWRVDNTMRRQPISLGPISVRGVDEPRLYSAGKAYVALMKDLFLPIVLLVMASMFTRQQAQTETDRASWNLLLERIHENTAHHYLPIAAAARDAAAKFEVLNLDKPETIDDLTFRVLLFRKRTRVLFERIGGYQFNTRDGEVVAITCENAFLIAMRPSISRELLEEAKSPVGRYMELHSFKKAPLKDEAVQKFRLALIDWIKADSLGARAAFASLDVFWNVIHYDINLIYRFWYDERSHELPKMSSQLEKMSSVASTRDAAKLFRAYRRKMIRRNW